MIYDKSLSELAFQIGVVYDDYSVEKKEKIAKMIVSWEEKRHSWKEQEKRTTGFAEMQKRVQFDLESE